MLDVAIVVGAAALLWTFIYVCEWDPASSRTKTAKKVLAITGGVFAACLWIALWASVGYGAHLLLLAPWRSTEGNPWIRFTAGHILGAVWFLGTVCGTIWFIKTLMEDSDRR